MIMCFRNKWLEFAAKVLLYALGLLTGTAASASGIF